MLGNRHQGKKKKKSQALISFLVCLTHNPKPMQGETYAVLLLDEAGEDRRLEVGKGLYSCMGQQVVRPVEVLGLLRQTWQSHCPLSNPGPPPPDCSHL